MSSLINGALVISRLYSRLCVSAADLRKENELRFSSCEVERVTQLSGRDWLTQTNQSPCTHWSDPVFVCITNLQSSAFFNQRYLHGERHPNKARCFLINIITLAHWDTSFMILSWGSLVSIIVGSTKYPFLSSHFPPAITVRLGDDFACSSQPLILPKDLQKKNCLKVSCRKRHYISITINKDILTLSSITAEKNVLKSSTGCKVKQKSIYNLYSTYDFKHLI